MSTHTGNDPAADPIDTAPVFRGLTRPPLAYGVTTEFFAFEATAAMLVFVITKSPLSFVLAAALHGAGYLACARDPRIFTILVLKLARTPPTPNSTHWKSNSYMP